MPMSPALARLLTTFAAPLALTLAVGCGGDKPTTAKAPEAAPEKTEKTPETAPEAGGEKVKTIEGGDPADDRFTLNIEPPADAAVGAEGKVKLSIVPTAPWHMNLDYPTTLAISPPSGVTLAKAELKKDDALRLDDGGCEYEVAFTPSAAGDASFTGKLKFAVCQDDACAPVEKDVEFRVAVK
ncbi:MAG: hypothetical protein H6710_05205 [Myxococcales bacterium]|nr:hypothetical protein [Myxococcales bacterium]MCB9705551.1 hypothetical protein [Myxococcales bacterium]